MIRLFAGSISVQMDLAKGMRRSPTMEQRRAAGFLEIGDYAERAAGGVENFAADQVRLIDFVAGQLGALFEGDGDFGASQLFGV